jgi:osmotically-inducible protein OsmY
MRTLKAFIAGVGAAYFFDPAQGRRRRRMVVDQAAGAARKLGRYASKKARFQTGRLRGLLARATRVGSRPEVTDDATVLQRIRSEAFREAGVSTKEVDVYVEAGVAKLQGSVPESSLADDLVRRVSKVPGVRDVEAAIEVSRAEARSKD